MMSSYANDTITIMKEFKAQGYFPKMLLGQRGGFMSSGFAKTLGADADTVLTTARWVASMNNDASAQIAQLYKDKTGSELVGDVLVDVWNGVLLAVAVNQAGTTDSTVIRSVLADGLDLDPSLDPMALEGYAYGETGENENTACIIVQYDAEGSMHTVYPEDKATQTLTFPSPAWSER